MGSSIHKRELGEADLNKTLTFMPEVRRAADHKRPQGSSLNQPHFRRNNHRADGDQIRSKRTKGLSAARHQLGTEGVVTEWVRSSGDGQHPLDGGQKRIEKPAQRHVGDVKHKPSGPSVAG